MCVCVCGGGGGQFWPCCRGGGVVLTRELEVLAIMEGGGGHNKFWTRDFTIL